MQIRKTFFSKKQIIITILSVSAILFTGCKGDKLKEDIAPMADAMCRFIDVQNKLKASIESNDTVSMQKYMAEQKQMQVEMTVLNEEFKKKYSDKINDQEFGKKFSKVMNEALLECPHLSKEDREMMEKGMGGN